MKRYREEILNRLLDKYEKSKSFNGSNSVNQSFTLNLSKEFPEYDDHSKVAAIQAIELAVGDLKESKLIIPNHRKNGLLYGVSLNTEKLEDCYKYLKRKPKKDTNQELLSLFENYSKDDSVLGIFCADQIEKITRNKNLKYYKGSIDEMKQVLDAVKAALNVSEETYERDFSIRTFGDSKTFEKIRSTVVTILYEYGDFPEKETVLKDLNIVKNPGQISFKGKGILSLSGQALDLSPLGDYVAVSSSMLDKIDRIKVTGKRVITIENLTSFNSFIPQDEFVIYLGGYHNHARREFIKKLYEQNPDVGYYHYGDIDAGGFYILQHLRNKTGIHFEPYCMDVKTLKSNKKYTKPLTENDVKRLKNLMDGEFDEVIAYMLKYNCKLEQEALD